MLIYKSKWFKKWADKEGLADESLKDAIDDVSNGLSDAYLGGHVYKKRVAIEGQGKSGGLKNCWVIATNSLNKPSKPVVLSR